MYYAKIKKYDVANGPGVRVSLFVSGCTHHCKGCFNEEAWDFKYGNKFTENTIQEIIEALKPEYINGLTLLGGEPFEYANQEGILPLLEKVRKIYPEKSIWAFSGYLFDKQIIEEMTKKTDVTKKVLSYIDVLVDGKFELEKKDPTLFFRGSFNQRIIDVKKSLKTKKVVLHKPIYEKEKSH